MKFKKKIKPYKKCPRCGNKCLRQQDTCEECGLVFARLEYASNKAAKRKIRHFDKDFIIYTTQYPKDVSWWKLILLTFLTGIVGGHYYYVGKYWKGALMTTGFVYLVFCTIFNAPMVEALTTYYAYLPIGILGISWIVSLIYVACKKFKVPVIVEVPEQIVTSKREEFFADLDIADVKTETKQNGAKKSKGKVAPTPVTDGNIVVMPSAKKNKTKKKSQKATDTTAESDAKGETKDELNAAVEPVQEKQSEKADDTKEKQTQKPAQTTKKAKASGNKGKAGAQNKAKSPKTEVKK